MGMKPQYFRYTCPHCQKETNATQVAASLPDEVLLTETARRNGRKQTPHAGPGRPTVVRCPGCEEEMTTAELLEHRVPCLRDRLKKLPYRNIQLHPKDPDPYPNFSVTSVSETEVEFEKLSSDQHLKIELRKIAEVTVDSQQECVYIRVLGRVIWDESIQHWRFVPTRIGRPAILQT